METNYRTLAVTVGALALNLLMVSNAAAQCGASQPPQANHNSHPQPGQAHLVQSAFVTASASGDAAIVGFWHVKFVSEGSEGIPDGTEVDAGYSQWHSDGTEIMNSAGHSPITSAFCLGVWKQVSDGQYRLNHFAAAWDSTGSQLVGPVNIKETVTLDSTGNKFSGTFSIDPYDEAGNHLGHIIGKITGTRIGVYTKEESIF